jgi:ABC-type dipeptide/oligopeptide/nickel transport system permease component
MRPTLLKRVARRALVSAMALIGASILSFLLLRLAPGDPVGLVLGPFASSEARSRLRTELRLDEPVYVQYFAYICDFLHGEWGYSYSVGESVRDLFAERLPASLELALGALLFSLIFSFVLALARTYSRRRWVRRAVDCANFVGYSIPQFWLGLILLVLFFCVLGIAPGPEGRLSPNLDAPGRIIGFVTIDALLAGRPDAFLNALWHLALPSITLGLSSMAFLSRILHVNLEIAEGQAYVLASRGRGLSRWGALTKHALPNALTTSATAAGVIVGVILTGGALVESTFLWPGIGALVTSCVQKQDYSVVQAFILFCVVVFVAANLIVDLIVARIDPRLRENP